jgi:hypothetical protein
VSFHHRTVTQRLVALDVSHPAAVGRGRGEVTVKQVISDAHAGNADGRGLPLLPHQRAQAGLAHKPFDALAPDLLAVIQDQVRQILGEP